MYKAVSNGHHYAQSPKIGSIFVFTNYPCFKECPVEQAYVFGLWKRYKMEDDVAQQEIIRARGRGDEGLPPRDRLQPPVATSPVGEGRAAAC